MRHKFSDLDNVEFTPAATSVAVFFSGNSNPALATLQRLRTRARMGGQVVRRFNIFGFIHALYKKDELLWGDNAMRLLDWLYGTLPYLYLIAGVVTINHFETISGLISGSFLILFSAATVLRV